MRLATSINTVRPRVASPAVAMASDTSTPFRTEMVIPATFASTPSPRMRAFLPALMVDAIVPTVRVVEPRATRCNRGPKRHQRVQADRPEAITAAPGCRRATSSDAVMTSEGRPSTERAQKLGDRRGSADRQRRTRRLGRDRDLDRWRRVLDEHPRRSGPPSRRRPGSCTMGCSTARES
jgi:hypothetical protein